MNSNRRPQAAGDDPCRFDDAGLRFEYSVTAAPGGGVNWTVSCHADGLVVQGSAPAATVAWDRAIKLSLELRRAIAAGDDPVLGEAGVLEGVAHRAVE